MLIMWILMIWGRKFSDAWEWVGQMKSQSLGPIYIIDLIHLLPRSWHLGLLPFILQQVDRFLCMLVDTFWAAIYRPGHGGPTASWTTTRVLHDGSLFLCLAIHAYKRNLYFNFYFTILSRGRLFKDFQQNYKRNKLLTVCKQTSM